MFYMPRYLREFLTTQELAALGFAAEPEPIKAERGFAWRDYKRARTFFACYLLLELSIGFLFLRSSLLNWQDIPWSLQWPSSLRSLLMASLPALAICLMQYVVAAKTFKLSSFGLWEAECLFATFVIFLARLLDINFCVSLYVEGERPTLTFVAIAITLGVSLLPRVLGGLLLLSLLFSGSSASLVRLATSKVSPSMSRPEVKPMLQMTKLMGSSSKGMNDLSVSLEAHPASLKVVWLAYWASCLSILERFKSRRLSISSPWRRSPVWDAPELLLSISDVSASAVEMADRAVPVSSTETETRAAVDSHCCPSLARDIKRKLAAVDLKYAASDFKILQLANFAYLFDHYLIGHVLREELLAKDLLEELEFLTSLWMFVWCHLTILAMNLIKFHTLMSRADDQMSWEPLISLVASLLAASNAFFVHTFDQQLVADLMDDD